MADIRRPGLTSLYPFVILLSLLQAARAHAHALDFPTAGISTGWSSTATMEHAVNFEDGPQVRSLLLRRSREGSGPSYACGFYGDPSIYSFYFAIFIIQVNSSGDVLLPFNSKPQVVWKANGNRPVAENATVQLGSDGDLVLTDADGTKVWSTNTSGESVAGVNLTEYGNLVLFGDGGNDIVWDSFDYPTDSLVPGQKLRIGQKLTYGDEGNIYLSATPTGLMSFSGTEPPTRHACFLPTDNTGKVEYFEFMNGSISTNSSGQYMPPSQFLRLKYDGSLAVYKWNSTLGFWGRDSVLFTQDSYCSASFHPTAGISTRWLSTPKNMEDILNFADGSQVRSPLLRRREDGGPTYSCGFYCKGPCNSFLFAIIIISLDSSGNILPSVEPQVVWVANRGHPVGGNATLHLVSDGDLVLTDSDGAKVWSTGTSGESVNGMNLTECGNLVLFGGNKNDTTVWESFAHPTDTMVPGQNLQVGQRLTASDSATNSTEGLYYLLSDSTGFTPFVKSNPPTRYSYPIVRTDGTRQFLDFTNGATSSSPSSAQCRPPTQFLRLESDGHLRVYGWIPTNGTWGETEDILYSIFTSFTDSATACFYPTACGKYGICSGNDMCMCPQWVDTGINYFMQVDDRHPKSGCKEVTPLSCGSPYTHTLLRLDNISYFSCNFNTPDVPGATEIGCKNACEKNCSCKAAFFQYLPSAVNGDCFLANEVFSLRDDQDEKKIYAYDTVAFIKVQIPGSHKIPDSQEPRKPRALMILGSTLGGLFLLILVVGSLVLVGRRKLMKERDASAQLEEEEDLQQFPGMPKRFSFDELNAATDGFCRKLGQGGFGSVYEGWIDAKAIAVKCLDNAGQGRKEFLAEVQTIGKIHHVNLVKLIGYCAEKSRRLLVYEFMPNGSLDGWIFSRDHDPKASLDWQMRRKIILGVAKGLSYLHEECSQRIAHLDIKPQNILLDDKFEARISDFGLAKLIDRDLTHVETRTRGTIGYLAPEWLSSMITEKADVYSFGVVVLEVICGRRNLDRSQPEEDIVLVSLLKKKAENNELVDLVDETIKINTDCHGEVMKMMKIVMRCLQHEEDRPSMSTVVKILEGAMEIESNLEDMFRTASTIECNDGIGASSYTPISASVLSGAR